MILKLFQGSYTQKNRIVHFWVEIEWKIHENLFKASRKKWWKKSWVIEMPRHLKKNRCSNLPNDKVDHLRRDEEEEGVAEVEHRRPEVVNTEAPHLDR